MSDARYLRPHSRPVTSGPPSPTDALPDDLAPESARRLRAACIICTAVWTLLLAVNHLVAPHLDLRPGQVIPWPAIADALALGIVLLSLAVYRLAPRAARAGGSLVTIGIAYEITLAFAIGVINQWEPQAVAGRLSWVCVLILIFPSIVPGPPRRVLTASLIAASMDPVGLAIARARGLELLPLELLVWTYLPNYICAALAVLPSSLIIHLGREVRRARLLGSYRLVERIGMGGMGEVWRAEHQLLARPAAIKLIRGHGMVEAFNPAAEKRFRREAEAAASLRSPHTIQLYDFGISRDGRLYYVMELLDGIDLETLVARFGPQPPARVAQILRQACHSLAEAHAAGLVHRDIKPANLHLGRVGLDCDFLKVLDFGLVKGEHRWDREDLRLTNPELTAGTPAYMAPELSSDEPVDGRADLYALGCVGYFLLTGTLVFQASTAVQLIVQHMQAEPEPPSARLGKPIPDGLERLVLWCLAKSPEDRPDGARELGDALEMSDAGEWTEEQARRWWETAGAEETGADLAPTGMPSTTVLEPALPGRAT